MYHKQTTIKKIDSSDEMKLRKKRGGKNGRTKNNAVATAGNIAHKLHGTAQVVRGAVTADFIAAISGATKAISPKVIAAIIITILLVVLTSVLVIFTSASAV